MSAADTYASNHAALMRDLGRSQAEAKLQSGAIWGNALNQVGQIAANLPGQLADDRRAKQQEAIWQANLDEFNQKKQENQWLKDAMNSSVGPDGSIDETRLTENLQMLGAAELAPRAVQTIRESKEAAVRLQNAMQTGQLNEMELGKHKRELVLPYFRAVAEAEGNPAVLEAALQGMALDPALGPKIAAEFRQSIEKDPNAVRPFVEAFIQPAEADKPVVVGEGGMLVDPKTGKVIAENAKPEAVQSLDDQLAAAFKAGDRKTINAIVKLQADIAAGKRAPESRAANYQRIETVDAAGNPVIQFMTPEEVRAQGGIKTSPKTTAKATGPAAVDAVLGEIEALSKKINTVASGPGANIQGMVRRGASALNMDNEVSEYQRLVEGFIPIMARSVGHTGVLTQMDVDSTKALFPKVGDNSTLSTNLIARVKRIMTALQDPSVAALGPDASFSQKMNAAMAIANKSGTSRSGGAGPTKGGGADPLGIRK